LLLGEGELSSLANKVFGEPDVAIRVDIDADAHTLQSGAGQVDAMPAGGGLVDHRFLDLMDAIPRCWVGTGVGDIFATVRIAGEAFIGNALALGFPIGAGMAEAAMKHIPAVQACATGQGLTPGVGIEASCGSITIDDSEDLPGELCLFVVEGRRRAIRGRASSCIFPFAGARARSTVDTMCV